MENDLQQAENIFISIAKQYADYNLIKDELREKDLTDKQYNHILEHWNDILRANNL